MLKRVSQGAVTPLNLTIRFAMRFKYLLFFVLSFAGFSHSAFAGHLFSQNSLNTPVTISAGTGVVIHQLGYESASGGQLGNFSIYFNQNQNSSANAALAWSTGDSLKITIGNYSLTVNYDTPGGTITNSNNSPNSATGRDSVLQGLTLSPAPGSGPNAISTTTLAAGSTGYVWSIEALTGSFSFEGYRIYFAGATFDGTNADTITQSSVISQQQIQQQVPPSNPAPTIPDIISGNDSSATINKLSNVGNSLFTNRFNGGTLKVDVTNTDATAAFTIVGHGAGDQGYIDQNSKVATFSGLISDDGAARGRLVILNGDGSSTGGKIILTKPSNTYSGGTEVRPGATLSIGYAGSIGSGGLDLIGSSTVPAILETTRTMEIGNQITVTGDPVFSVAPTTTLTVSSPITGSGDVVAAGGGTLNLTAVNTYTGPTSIIESATLNLTGAGSIATSIGFNNSNGTFNITGANGNVSLGGDYAQASAGNLSMNISATNNQKLLVTGAASLAGGLSLAASSGNYTAGRYTLISANGVSGSFGSLATNLPTYTRLGYQLGYDANNVYLYLTPNLSDTQASLQNSANLLQGTFTLQNSVLVNGFTYDCPVFDKNGICVSAGGRNTTVQAEGINNTSGLLIASYQLDKDYSRIGAYIDQNLSVSGPGTVKMNNSTPMIGLFGVWAENLDTTGWGARIGAAYGQKNTTVTRQVVNTSEPGSGSANLNTQGVQLTGKYGFAVMNDLIVSPYVGMRYTQNNMGGYTEGASASVTSPLTYSALNTNATTALAGAEAKYKLDPKTTVFASAGVETDTNTKNGTYSATGFGLTNLTPINFNPNPVKTRPTATVGGFYDIEKNQRFGVTGIYRQEPFQAVSTTTVMATYTVGM